MALQPFIDGIALSAGLIVAIGAQNAFVIRQGVTGRHLFILASTCVFCDLLLITIVALGVGQFISELRPLRIALVALGIGFLGWYGVTSWIRAFRGGQNPLLEPQGSLPQTRGRVALLAIGFSLLNPHA